MPSPVWHAICNKNRDPVNVTLYLKRNVERLTTLRCTLELDVKPSYVHVYVRTATSRSKVKTLRRTQVNRYAHAQYTHGLSQVLSSFNMAAKKEVLVVYGDRRRPIVFEPSEDPKEERLRLLEAVKVAFSDLLGEEEACQVYLQTKSDKWEGQMIDVVDSVCDGAILHLQQQLETTPDSKVD